MRFKQGYCLFFVFVLPLACRLRHPRSIVSAVEYIDGIMHTSSQSSACSTAQNHHALYRRTRLPVLENIFDRFRLKLHAHAKDDNGSIQQSTP